MRYRIYCSTPDANTDPQTYSNYLLFDYETEGAELQSAVLTRSFSGNMQDASLVFQIPPSHRHYDKVLLSLSTITVYDNDVEIFRGRPISCETNNVKSKKFTCEHMMKFLIDVPDIFSSADDDGNVVIQSAITAVINGYNQYAEDNRKILLPSSFSIPGKAKATKGASVYSNLSAWLKEAGYYAKIAWNGTGYQLSFSNDTGENSDNFSVVFGENVMDYLETVNLNKLYTAVYPIGKDSSDDSYRLLLDSDTGITKDTDYPVDTSKKIIYNDAAIKNYGRVILYTEIDLKDEQDKRQTLYNKGLQALKNAAGAVDTFTISVVDPRLIGINSAIPMEGNYYPVVIPIPTDNPYQKLTKIVTNMTKPSAGSLTFGGTRNLLTDSAAATTVAAGRAAATANAAATPESVKSVISSSITYDVAATLGAGGTVELNKTAAECYNAVAAGKTARTTMTVNGVPVEAVYYICASKAGPAGSEQYSFRMNDENGNAYSAHGVSGSTRVVLTVES